MENDGVFWSTQVFSWHTADGILFCCRFTRFTKSSRAWNLVENVTFACEMAWCAFWIIIVEKWNLVGIHDNWISKIQLVNNRIVQAPQNYQKILKSSVSSLCVLRHYGGKKDIIFVYLFSCVYLHWTFSPFQSSHTVQKPTRTIDQIELIEFSYFPCHTSKLTMFMLEFLIAKTWALFAIGYSHGLNEINECLVIFVPSTPKR